MVAPRFLLEKKFLINSVIYITGFSIIFLLIYRPFSFDLWFGVNTFQRLSETIAFYASGITILAVSRYLLHMFDKKRIVTMGHYALWITAEFVLLAILYLLFAENIVVDGPEMSLELVARTSMCVALILLIPMSFFGLIQANKTMKAEIEALKVKLQALTKEPESRLINLYDNKDELKLSIQNTAIYYIEAQDNYVQIFYDHNGEMKDFLLRCPTKKVEKAIEGSSLMRCHRSYIVNLDHVKEFIKGHNSSTIVVDSPNAKAIPVSKSYYKNLPASVTGNAPLQIS